jgi:hypothetical protein
MSIDDVEDDIWSLYKYELRSLISRQKYQKRLEKYFDFIKVEGENIEEKTQGFLTKLFAPFPIKSF